MDYISNNELIKLQAKKSDLKGKKQKLKTLFNKCIIDTNKYVELRLAIDCNIKSIANYIEKCI